MRSLLQWTDQIKDKDGNQLCVYDMAFSPDSDQLIVAADIRVYVYNTNDGNLIQALKGHKDNVICVAYSMDGKRFASGSADKQVIIWTAKMEGILKYSHNEAIRCIEYNPLSHQLVSCTASDFGLWSPEQKAVTKQKISGQINSCCWSSDGHYLALALTSGIISIRNRTGEEKNRIERLGGPMAPIWGVSFCPLKEDDIDIFVSVDWTQTLSFYDINGKAIAKERNIGFDPLNVSYFLSGDYLLVSGSNKKALLYTKEGIFIGCVAEQSSWIWCSKPSPDGSRIAVGSQDGTVALYELSFSTVHSLYKERYAYREKMTDVIIQHLITEEKVRIKCRDVVKKLAIYRNRLAIQLPERVIIYELTKESDNTDMHYKVKEKINNNLECTLIVVCSENLVLCQEKKLQCISFNGNMEREWALESSIRYIRVTGGPPQREGLLVGLKSGQVVQIFINNPFPINILKISNPIRCLDISILRKKLAVVDDKGMCSVYNLRNKQLLYQESNANSVSWNTHFDDMLSYSGNGLLCIKASDFPPHQQNLQGFVVGFCGAKVFCLQYNSVTTVEVSQSAPMYQYIEKSMFLEAYKTACLKVTESDWEILANSALDCMNLEIARKSLIRLKNWLFLELIQSYTRSTTTQSKTTELSLMGDVMAYRGYFGEAAKLYKQSKDDNKAIKMYSDMGMSDATQEYISSDSTNKSNLLNKRTDWIHNSNEPKAAVEMYLASGDTVKAIEIIGQHGWLDMMMTVVQQLDRADRKALTLCADFLIKSKHYLNAIEVYKKIGDIQNLAIIYIKSSQWQEAFKLADDYPHLKQDVYVPYAIWLAENDRFVEAQHAFHKAGKQTEASHVLQQLMNNAINENRFNDASYYCWILANQYLDLANESPNHEMNQFIDKYYDLSNKADIYYAYHNIYRYVEEPFTSYFADALFNMARYLYHQTMHFLPNGVSKVTILYALSKQGRNLGAHKLVRHLYEVLHTMHVPNRFQEAIDMGDIMVRAKPFSDSEDLQSLCYRCSTTNPLYNNKDILPLVQFEIEDNSNDINASKIQHQIKSNDITNQISDSQWQEENYDNYQSLKLDINYMNLNLKYRPIRVKQSTVEKMKPTEIIVVKYRPPLTTKYYRNLMPDISITVCQFCFRFFHSDEYEMQETGRCPFCRSSHQRSQH
ncbi:intraflagellar transport protein 122 homolog [Oppia nitens]|uniref:intraflagellar transport protein 122 homolog n=1 Tax=Oppia nitens TaxID=1686743 RepID=UPI0023DC6612|nr:intraflagellar transport protein 122 homolog [Oppia nitens]